MTSVRKSAANRRNARSSTGPRTAAGKAMASLNARKHGLNTPVPDYMLQACQGEFKTLLDFARIRSPSSDLPDTLPDILYALAAYARLRDRRARLMQTLVSVGASGDIDAEDALNEALVQLRRLETYERKVRARLAGLLEGC